MCPPEADTQVGLYVQRRERAVSAVVSLFSA